MLIHETIADCDSCQKVFTPPIQAYAAVAQGATGRWCVVLHMCGGCVKDKTGVLTAEEARTKIEESGNGYPDF